MSGEAGDTPYQFFQFVDAFKAHYVTRDGNLVIDDPEVRRRLIRAIDAYTAIYRKGCTPPASLTWDGYGNNEGFLKKAVVMTPNNTLSIPNAEARASGLLQEQRDDRMAARPGRRSLSDQR
jgi:multiple sugar transport system substrate-binding protein